MKTRNVLIILFVISIVAFITITYFNVRNTERSQNFSPIVIPYSYSFTDQHDGKGEINIKCFIDKADGKYSNKQNYASMEIVSGEQRFRADWADEIQIQIESPLKWHGIELYSFLLPISFFLSSGVEMPDAYLEIKWINGTTDQLYLGDISFKLVNLSGSYDSPITSAWLNPVGRIGSNDVYELAALCLELDSTTEIVLTDIDLGLSRYGIDFQNIHYYHDQDIQIIRQKLDQKTIFDDYDICLKNVTSDKITTKTGNLTIPAGKSLIILPLTTSTKGLSVNETGLILTFMADDQFFNAVISQKKLFDQVSFSESALEHLIKP